MGGIGSASLPLRHPGMFAAAAPLCGYHSYFVRRDFIGKLCALGSGRSPRSAQLGWAFTGNDLQLYVVPGTLEVFLRSIAAS